MSGINQRNKLRRAATQCLFGSLGIGLLTFVCFSLRLSLATTGCLYLIVIVLVSLQGSFLSSAVVSLVASVFLNYYFVAPVFHFRPTDPIDYVELLVFLTTSAVISGLVSRVRKSAEEQKHLTEELRRRQAYLAEAQKLSHAGSLGWKVSTGEILWSEETFRIFQYDSTTKPTVELILQRVHPDDMASVKLTIERASRDGKDLDHEYRLVMPDGSTKCIHVVAHALSDESGSTEFIGAVMDVTKRKQAEAALREQASLLNLTHDRIFVRDMNNVITYWNHGAEEFYGWTAAEAVGKVTTHELLQTVFPAPLNEIDEELLRTGRWEGELMHTRADGIQVTVASRWSLQRDEHGRPVAVLETNNDITERKRAEEALRQAQADLAHMTRLTTMGELTASIAHEVNQPLTAVLNNANACLDLLPNDGPNLEEVREALAEIVEDATRAGAVIMRVRQLARRTPTERSLLDMKDVVHDVLALARYESASRRITIRTDLPNDLPSVSGDRVQLQQVLLNLVMNGMDAMNTVEPSQRVLVIRARLETRDGMPAVLLSVQDAGVGFKPEEMVRLFEAFYTTKPHGMGMGLTISRSIIEAHSGRLWAETNRGSGATFLISLPAAPERPDEGGRAAGDNKL